MCRSWLLSVVLVTQFIRAPRLVSQTPDSVAPAFALRTLNGDTVSLAEFKGRPVFLNFWATWCAPCRGEMTSIITAYTEHQDQQLIVLAINLTDQERMRDVQRFVAELHMPFPVLLDEKGKVRQRYALRGVPSSVFIDAQGIVRLVNRGPISNAMIERGLTRILPPSASRSAP